MTLNYFDLVIYESRGFNFVRQIARFILIYNIKTAIYRQVILQAVITDRDFWIAGRKIVSAIWDAHARLYHGYEVVGLENLPTDGPALIVYYHGAIPVDIYYLIARVVLERGRLIYTGMRTTASIIRLITYSFT